jgi:hypothetical protein
LKENSGSFSSNSSDGVVDTPFFSAGLFGSEAQIPSETKSKKPARGRLLSVTDEHMIELLFEKQTSLRRPKSSNQMVQGKKY